MAKTLHITNGDGFTEVLKTLDIPGDIITWREMLCEGKTTHEVGSETFWRQRYEYLNRAYKVTKDTFINKTLKEYRNLCNQKSQEDIVLWFNKDLFCQINMVAVLSWIKKNRTNANIYFIGSVTENETQPTAPLSTLDKTTLEGLIENKLLLNKDDIEFGDYSWQLYCENRPIRLQSAIKQNNSQQQYLTKVIQTQLHRYPSLKNGLNELENKMLTKALQQQIKNKDLLVEAMLEDPGYYGYGDMQYYKIASKLRPLFRSFTPAKLTKTGAAVAEKLENYYPHIRNENEFLGGTPKYSYLFVEDSAQLLKL